MENLKENIEFTQEISKESSYSLRIGSKLLKKINRAVASLKKEVNYNYSKKQWLQELIEEKANREEIELNEVCNNDLDELGPKRLHLPINRAVDQKIEKILKLRKQRSDDPSLSKNNWIVEAIKEKLERIESKHF